MDKSGHPFLMPDRYARRHVVVTDWNGHDAVSRFLALAQDTAAPVDLFRLDDAIELCGDSQTLQMQRYDDIDVLIGAVITAVRAAGMGVRVYLVGHEAFAARVSASMEACGLSRREIQCQPCGIATLQLFCVHCRKISQGNGAQRKITCPGCNRRLEVRHHYSRRLGAYLAVSTDVDAACDAS
ncbi:MAG: hypothetical protein KGL42_14440 [Betaproteobacteria bacterium]|nr:hypothetical protein [Betaproteobacteria bacterium]